MAFSTYIGVTPVSVPLDTTAVGRGLRVKKGSNGLYTVQDASARGEYATLNDGVASEVVEGAALGTPARVPLQTLGAVAVGDLVYAAAGGAVDNSTNTSTILIGKSADAVSVASFVSVDLMVIK